MNQDTFVKMINLLPWQDALPFFLKTPCNHVAELIAAFRTKIIDNDVT